MPTDAKPSETGLAADWPLTAWNGISFTAPANWQPAQVGRRYLLLEDADGPRLEIKWSPIKGRFSPQQQLRRLGKAVKPVPLPRAWSDALPTFQAEAFSWQGPELAGKGILLFCDQCRTASLIQFHQQGGCADDLTAAMVLASFRDHTENGWNLWSLFDFQTCIPENYTLTRHSFQPGLFRLDFSSGRKTLTIYRWSPASVLLKNRDLAGFAATLNPPDLAPVSVETGTASGLEWSCPGQERKPGPLARFRPRKRTRLLRLWAVPDRNRIIGVDLSPASRPDIEIFHRICADFVCV